MSREIKFRAWDILRKLMINNVTNMELNFQDNKMEITDVEDKFWRYKAGEFELMQFTGLCDKNGTEIYEGDIIKIESRIRYVEGSELVYTNAKIIWNNEMGRWEYVYDKTKQIPLFAVTKHNQSKIIGNIFENPELLEASE